jgi:HPt (histidine-containing phosphotransfer) domain-containing protein
MRKITPPSKVEPLPIELGSGEHPLEQGTRRSPKIVDLLLRLVPGQVDSIRSAIERQDVAETTAQAHKLKGSCLSVGAMRMARICHAIEGHGDAGDLESARVELPALLAALVDLLDALEVEKAAFAAGHRDSDAPARS